MTQNGIVTDLNKCVGCLACTVACKTANNIPIGNFWNKVIRVGPNPKYEGATLPDMEMYFLPVSCQHCEDPECIKVCPTNASHKLDDGTVQIDKSKCIGCGFCAMSCPYNVRHFNEDEGVIEKCTLCEQKIAQGELPQCVAQCSSRARFFGDWEKGMESFEAPGRILAYEATYEDVHSSRISLPEAVAPYTEDNLFRLDDLGNHPSFAYILRDTTWQGGDI